MTNREYQLDQSSLIPATAAADPVLDREKRPAHFDRSLHINFRIADNPPTTSINALLVPPCTLAVRLSVKSSRLRGTDSWA